MVSTAQANQEREDASIVVSKKRFPGFRRVEHDFPIVRHFVDFVNTNHFYAELWRHIRRVPTHDIPFAAVAFDHVDECYVLGWNPTTFAVFSKDEIQGVLQHEVLHIVLRHVAMLRMPRNIWNIAEDLAINSIIVHGSEGKGKLPLFAVVPGVRSQLWDPKTMTCSPISDEDREKYPFVFFIETLPKDLSSHEYYGLLRDSGLCKELTEGDMYVIESGDKHPWECSADDARTIDQITRRMIERATKTADAYQGWGNIPSSLRETLRSYVNRSVDWTTFLSYFFGSLRHTLHESTMKRINRRFPYVHPGNRHTHVASVLVAIDQSGSVDNGMLELIFSVIRALNEEVSIDYVPFDCSCSADEIKRWELNDPPPVVREKNGGTDFDVVTELVNDTTNQGRWDAVIICTDGQAPAPGPCRIQRVWLTPEACNLYFSTSEMHIRVNDAKSFA